MAKAKKTKKVKVNLRELVAAVRGIAAAMPDHVYERPDPEFGCKYVHGSGSAAKPGCIMAIALYAIGVPLKVLAEHENKPIIMLLRHMTDIEVDALSTKDSARRNWLHVVQLEQDDNSPWGECVQTADAYLVESGRTT